LWSDDGEKDAEEVLITAQSNDFCCEAYHRNKVWLFKKWRKHVLSMYHKK